LVDEDVVAVLFTRPEIENILKAYDRLAGNSPFFKFNAETQGIVDRLRATQEDQPDPSP
jgi:hypothetical protein